MDETESSAAARYYCHRCFQMVNPIVGVEMIKCPLCQSGFVEEIDSSTSFSIPRGDSNDLYFGGSESATDRTLSLWAPILLGMMSNPHRRRRLRRRLEFEDEDDDEDDSRRRRSSVTIHQLLNGIRAGMLSESDNSENENRDVERDTGEIGDQDHVILVNPFNQTIIVQGRSNDSNNSQNQNQNPIGSLGDYFIGPGLDLLLQHLAENDPNRYGTPPAQKEAVEAMPTVKIVENLQCSVCLEDLEVGTEAKEMPCKHKFHSRCILPWLELHSSCPVCRFQLPSDESKLNCNDSTNNSRSSNGVINNGDGLLGEEGDEDWDGRSRNGRRFSVPLPWPLSLFSSSGNGNSSSASTSLASPSSSSTHAPRRGSRTDGN
ncbi:Ubiquitin--protein ligase [Bertholletia excelsa]